MYFSNDSQWQKLAKECYESMSKIIERWGNNLPTAYGILSSEGDGYISLANWGCSHIGLHMKNEVVQVWRRGPVTANIQDLLNLAEKIQKIAKYYASDDMKRAIEDSTHNLQVIKEVIRETGESKSLE